jgi:ATP-dependent Lon protease
MRPLDQKISELFSGVVVRKDLVKTVKGNAIVPTYVLEYLLGQYCATSDEASIQSGIETVKEILRKHYVHRNEAGLVKSLIREQGRHQVIDKISVSLNEKSDVYEAEFSNLGIKKVLVDTDTVKKNPKLLVSGIWCIADLEYQYSEDTSTCPWLMNKLKPIQLSNFDLEKYIAIRKQFSTEEWIDLLIQSIGFNPEQFGKRSKLLQLVRLIPYCERNYNLIELGPKGTGKSHIYSEFSPHGILISGGEVSVPKLFVNNTSGRIGLVGYWDLVGFDEFAGKKKKADKALVDIMKNYMANKSFSRGIETLGAEASLAFVGNTQHTLPFMLKHSNLFDELPEQYYDSAFLDRLHFYIPGWEVDIIRGEMFSDGYGFVVDYLAEILRTYRDQDFSQNYSKYFSLVSDISTRDRDGINKTFSGLFKILFPQGEATKEEVEMILKFAIEGRKRIKDQLMRIDNTYSSVRFCYVDNETKKETYVKTLEEEQYPQHYKSTYQETTSTGEIEETAHVAIQPQQNIVEAKLNEGNFVFAENQRGVSFDKLIGPYIKDAKSIVITDPYIRLYYQARNLMEVIETIVKQKADDEEVEVTLITVADEIDPETQNEFLAKIRDNSSPARHIITDTGWKISLDRGLDIFQRFDMSDGLSISNRLQEFRACKGFEITYIKQ